MWTVDLTPQLAPSTFAGTVTAVATVITALGGLFLALAVFVPTLRETRKAVAASDKAVLASAEVKESIAEVHTIVNQQRTDMLNYQRALVRLLNKHGIEVPEDQSIDHEDKSDDDST